MTSPNILSQLLSTKELSHDVMAEVMRPIVRGELDEAVAAAFLMALRVRGETENEIAAAAAVLREFMVRLETNCDDLLDTCGTGGDGSGTFNISTATALVLASAGVRVVKHGNRSMSSRTGSADVLLALGVNIDGDLDRARRSLQTAGLAFCFGPAFHPALKNVAELRRKLGVPTIFNCLGPLANPAGARRQLLGVGRLDLLDRMTGALQRLGTERALVVHGRDGLDEVSLSAPTLVREVTPAGILRHEWTPTDFDLPPCSLDDLQAADPQASAAIILRVLDNSPEPATWIVQANAAAALWLAGKVPTLRDGVRLAADSIAAGKARRVLEHLRKI